MFKLPHPPLYKKRKYIYKYDAIIVLGAVMKWNKNDKCWNFPAIIKEYPGKLVFGQARALATREVQHLTTLLLITGGSNKHPKTGKDVSRADKLAKVVIKEYKVPSNKVISIGKLNNSNTLGNLENVVEYFKINPSILKLKRLGILCPRFQKERAKLMFKIDPFFKQKNIKITWLIVEDILEKLDPKYKKYFAAIYNTPEAIINKKMEKRGIEALKKNKYK